MVSKLKQIQHIKHIEKNLSRNSTQSFPHLNSTVSHLTFTTMDHVAILSKKFNFLSKILSGQKSIESRWTINRKPPYKTISPGDTVYFKNSGEAVTLRAAVSHVLFFQRLDLHEIRRILTEYGPNMGVTIDYARKVQKARYCTLIFLKNPHLVPPFTINKKGYGMMAAWITVPNISAIRR